MPSLLKKIRVPSIEMLDVAREFDVMMHEGYVQRNPFKPTIWGQLYSNVSSPLAADPALVMFVSGISGLGKTKCLQRILEKYPPLYVHPEFPNCVGGLTQLCWLYVQMPASGKLKDLVKALINATAYAFGDSELVKFLMPNKNDVSGSFSNWMRFVQGHYLGALVIDEVQNIFKLPTVKERKSKIGRDRAKLRLSDDETLKTLMNFIDTSGIPLMLVGTPDAEAVLQKRFAVSQRLTTGGKIMFRHPESHESNEFTLLLKTLEKYQWSDIPLVIDEDLRKFIYSVTAGIRRLVVALWRAAHKVAINSGSRNLAASHFKQAARTTLSHTQPAVDALLSGHPASMRRFEDLMSLVKMDAEDW